MQEIMIPLATSDDRLCASPSSPVLVATDGTAQSDTALAMGALLAQRGDALRVMTVVKPAPMAPDMPPTIPAEIQMVLHSNAQRAVRQQIARLLPAAIADAEVYDGNPALIVSKVAFNSHASMIVAGKGRHHIGDRLFGDETALRIAHLSTVPVLAVTAELNHAPRRVVVAVDFSESSLRAAQLALSIAGQGATVYLAHVAPRAGAPDAWSGWGVSYREDASNWLRQLREQLRIPQGMAIQRVLLEGDPAVELVKFSAGVGAELIATGSHGPGTLGRMLLGSVATRLLRAATCSVLVVPRVSVETVQCTTELSADRAVIEHRRWTSELDAFTRRNVGRRGSLEVDDPEIGAQAQQHDYPLGGVTYDSHTSRLDIMFGELGDVDRHLSRSIGDVTSIDLLTNKQGHDVALRIAHGAGQTLITFGI